MLLLLTSYQPKDYLKQVCCSLLHVCPCNMDLVWGLHVLIEDLLGDGYQGWVSNPSASTMILSFIIETRHILHRRSKGD